VLPDGFVRLVWSAHTVVQVCDEHGESTNGSSEVAGRDTGGAVEPRIYGDASVVRMVI
jgi:hypothetical protein